MSNSNPGVSLILLAVLLCVCIPLSWWTDSNLEFWLSHIAGRSVEVPGILSYALTVFTNFFGIVGNLLMELAKLAL